MELSIIIVNYNTKELLKQTIQSVISSTTNVHYSIIVVDNASTDGSCAMIKEEFPEVTLIENKSNLGFSKANNIGIRQAKSNYILLLNSDTIVKEGCLEKCLSYIKNDKNIGVGALGCKVMLASGKLDHACKRGFPSPTASLYYMLKLEKIFPQSAKYGQYTLNYLPEDEINEVDALTGAFMLVTKEAIEKAGLLDEDFFMYGEDIDWCCRIKEAGYKIVYYPEAEIVHLKGGSSKKKRNKTIYEFHRAMFLFYNKHYKAKYNFLVTAVVYAGISLKLLLSLIKNQLKVNREQK